MFKKEHFSPGGKAGANPARSRRCVPDEPAIPPNFREGAEEDDGSQKTRGEKSRFDARGDSGRLPGDFFFAKKRRNLRMNDEINNCLQEIPLFPTTSPKPPLRACLFAEIDLVLYNDLILGTRRVWYNMKYIFEIIFWLAVILWLPVRQELAGNTLQTITDVVLALAVIATLCNYWRRYHARRR